MGRRAGEEGRRAGEEGNPHLTSININNILFLCSSLHPGPGRERGIEGSSVLTEGGGPTHQQKHNR